MQDTRGSGIIALLVVISACISVYLLRIAEPTAQLLEFLLPRL